MSNKNIYKKFLQILFLLTLISPLVVDKRLFFPYVTGMALYFRLSVEILFIFWLIFIFLYSSYRLKINLLIGSIIFYLFIIILATIFSQNSFLSFWGDAERMMGLFGILHFIALFIIGSSIFRDRKELKYLLYFYLAVSVSICIYGIFQLFGLTSIKPGASRILATFGNAGTLASYLIFGFFLSLYLALNEKNKYINFIFSIIALIHFISIILTGTRGAYLGVALGLLFSIIIIIFKINNTKLKKSIIGSLLFLIVIYGFLFIYRQKTYIKDNLYLNRLTSFSFNDVTMKTRLMSWKWGIKGWKDKPIFGYGFENFSIPYNKYFQSEYYNYAAGDTYFDRAHNIVVELLSTTGILGLISYLIIFVISFYYLFKTFKRENNFYLFSIIGGLLIAYFIQNLLIFDLLPSMIGFMILLVFINNIKEVDTDNGQAKISKIKKIIILPISLFLLILLLYSYNNFIKKQYLALRDDVVGQITFPYIYEDGMRALKASVNYNTKIDLDLKSAAANTIFDNYRDGVVVNKNQKEDIDYAISLYRENLKIVPKDLYYNYKIAEIMDYRFVIDKDIKINEEAKKFIEKAISLSPDRAELYYIQAENLYLAGKFDEAIIANLKAVSLNDKFGQSYWELSKVYYLSGKFKEAKENLIKAIKLGYRLQESTIMSMASIFEITKNINNEIEYYEILALNGSKDYVVYTTLANKLSEIGDKQKAIKYAAKASELNPEIKPKIDKFIESMKK